MAARKRKLTPDQKNYLIDLKKKPNEDDIRYKEIIKQKLLEDDILIWLLNNKQLEDTEAENDEYFGKNIRPQYLIPEVQTDVQNFVCYEISFEDEARYNPDIKYQQIIFYILCHEKNNIVEEIGAARHDLIAGVLIDKFNGSNVFGNQLKLVSDKPSVTDNDYATRVLIFEQKTTNSLTKSDGRTVNLRR
jgi:hypothetical protein